MITFVTAIIVLASIGVVFWPLLKGVSGSTPGLLQDTRVSELLAQKDATLFAISELESDYNMGNLSNGDYRELRQKYEEKAVSLIKAVDELRDELGLDEMPSVDDEIEARVSALRSTTAAAEPRVESRPSRLAGKQGRQTPAGKSCPSCGAQLELDDLFCFRCGAALNVKCPHCSAAVGFKDRFCSRCGTPLDATGKGGKVA